MSINFAVHSRVVNKKQSSNFVWDNGSFRDVPKKHMYRIFIDQRIFKGSAHPQNFPLQNTWRKHQFLQK